ncbi:MAG: biopolymer transporter ExbD [Candidatus Kuenenia sp.]|nr:biopolymer transporter ExbD [Candidatus Kuenenia hertensis]
MMEFEGRKKVGTQLNIAPLIDVIFLLLLFLMLSAHFVTQPGIKITLPTAATAKLHPEKDITIFIAEDNYLYLNTEKVAIDALPDKLRTMVRESKKKSVTIRADERIDLGMAVKVMDIAKQAEAEGLIISTKAEEDVQ